MPKIAANTNVGEMARCLLARPIIMRSLRLLRSFFLCSLFGGGALLSSLGAVACADDPAPIAETPKVEDTTPPKQQKPPQTEDEKKPAAVTAPTVIDLGEVSLDSDITFNVPAGALGFNVVIDSLSSAPSPGSG